jgi:hypothetical protein
MLYCKLQAELSPEDIRDTGEINLLPLIPLTKGGATPESVSRMLNELDTPEHKDLALVGFKLASLVFNQKSQDHLAWLVRSFKEMHDILHDTPIYQLILEEGREKGLEEGRQKGLQEGRQKGLKEGRGKGLKEGLGKGLKEGLGKGLAKAQEEERLNLRMILINIVQARFPDLVEMVKFHTETIEDIATLRQLVIQLGTAQERENVQQCLTIDHPAT